MNKINSFIPFFNKTSGYGSFQLAIMKSISLADRSNLDKLSRGFPDLVQEYKDYTGIK